MTSRHQHHNDSKKAKIQQECDKFRMLANDAERIKAETVVEDATPQVVETNGVRMLDPKSLERLQNQIKGRF